MRPAGEPGQLTKSCINSGDQARRTTRLTGRGVTARTRFPSVAADGRIADALTHRISIDVQLSGRGSRRVTLRISASPETSQPIVTLLPEVEKSTCTDDVERVRGLGMEELFHLAVGEFG